MTYSLTTGRAAGAAVPEHFLSGTNWLDGIRKWAMAGVSVMPSLALGFTTDTYVMDGEYAPNFVELASHSRASKAWEPNWDGKSGSEVGWLKEYQVDERRVGIYGPRDEAASTNQIRNPRFENATAGAIGGGGVWPYVSVAGDGGVPYITAGTMTINGVGTESGWSYIEVNLSHPTSSTYVLPLEGVTIPSFVQNDPVCLSAGYKVVSGTITGTVYLITEEHQSGGGYLTEGSVTVAPTSAHTRHYLSRTVANASTASLYAFTSFALTGAHNVTVRIYTPQLEKSATPSSPILPTAGTPAAATRAADVVTGVTTDRASRGWYDTQWDYKSGGEMGSLLEFLPGVPRVGPKGLLVEEGTTNHIRNPRFEGATPGTLGSGGVLPANFSEVRGGMTWNVDEVGEEDGSPYLQITLSGTATGDAVLYFESGNIISALTGQDWTLSVGLKVISGEFPGICRFWVRGLTSGGDTSDDGSTQNPVNISLLGGVKRRFHVTKTLNDNLGVTATVRPGIYIDDPSGSVNCTFRIYPPQLEKKAYPTSVVLPEAGSPAAATRAADDPRLSLGSWFAGGAYSFALDYSLPANDKAASTLYALGIGNGASSETVGIGFTNTSTNRLLVVAGGSTRLNASSALRPNSQEQRIAVRLAQGDAYFAASGEVGRSFALPAMPSGADTVFLGRYPNGGGVANVLFVKSFWYFPATLANTELEALVA